MAQNELVHQYQGEAMVPAEFEVIRMPRNDAGISHGPRKGKPAKAKSKAKRAPGRPPLYNGTQRRIVAAALKRLGYTKGLEFLAKERNLDVSMTLARSVAKEAGLTFTRGRPAA